MYPKKERVLSLLDAALKEMDLLLEMSKDIHAPDDFVLEIIDALYVDRCNRSIWCLRNEPPIYNRKSRQDPQHLWQ